MSLIFGNANCSLRVRPNDISILIDNQPVVEHTNGSQTIQYANYSLAGIDTITVNGKIMGLADATLDTDALNRQSADARYSLKAQGGDVLITTDLDMNSFKIQNLANAASDTDALNRITADGRYYLNTDTLDTISIPTASVDLNNNKISNLSLGTLQDDAISLKQNPQLQWCLLYLTANLTSGLATPFTLPFDQYCTPSLPSGLSFFSHNTGVVTFSKSGTYLITANLVFQYGSRTDRPLTAKFQVLDSSNNEISGGLNNAQVPTHRALDRHVDILTSYSQMIQVQSGQKVKLVLSEADTSISQVSVQSSLHIQAVEITF